MKFTSVKTVFKSKWLSQVSLHKKSEPQDKTAANEELLLIVSKTYNDNAVNSDSRVLFNSMQRSQKYYHGCGIISPCDSLLILFLYVFTLQLRLSYLNPWFACWLCFFVCPSVLLCVWLVISMYDLLCAAKAEQWSSKYSFLSFLLPRECIEYRGYCMFMRICSASVLSVDTANSFTSPFLLRSCCYCIPQSSSIIFVIYARLTRFGIPSLKA